MPKLEISKVHDAYEKGVECPLCTLVDAAERWYLESFLGGRAMAPEARVLTNEKGFCPEHTLRLYRGHNPLGLAVMTHTHLQHQAPALRAALAAPAGRAGGRLPSRRSPTASRASATGARSATCSRRDRDRWAFTIVYLWKHDPEFPPRLAGSRGFCLDHLRTVVLAAADQLGSADLERFLADVLPLAEAGLDPPRGRGARFHPAVPAFRAGHRHRGAAHRPLADPAVSRGKADEEGVGTCRERTRRRARRARPWTASRRGPRGAARAGRRCAPRRSRVRVCGHGREVGVRGPRGDLPAADERGQGEQGPAGGARPARHAPRARAAQRRGSPRGEAGHLPGAPRRHAGEHDGPAPGDRGRHPALPAAPPRSPSIPGGSTRPTPTTGPRARQRWTRRTRPRRSTSSPSSSWKGSGRGASARRGCSGARTRTGGKTWAASSGSASPPCGATRARSATTRNGSRRTYGNRAREAAKKGKQPFEYAEAFKVLRW